MNEVLFHDDMGLIKSNRYLHTASDAAKEALFYLQETGALQANGLHRSHREGLESYLFFIVQEGSGILEYSGNTYELSKGDCVFIDCHGEYTHMTHDISWTLTWVHFNGPNVARVYSEYLRYGGRNCFRSRDFEKYQEILRQIRQIKKKDGPASFVTDMRIHEKLSALLMLLIEDAYDSKRESGLSVKRSDIQNVKTYLDNHYKSRISLDELSHTFFIDKYYMVAVFKERYGVTISNYVTRLRIDCGKKLLRFTDKTIEEIGDQCGLGGGNYFARVFKKTEGMSPGEFRRQWKEK